MPTTGERRRAERAGRWAETLAAAWLGLKGYRLLAKNFVARGGEADLVLARAGALVVVEVKLRRDAATARAAVTPRAQQRIARATQAFQARWPGWAVAPVRFDLVAIGPGWPPLRHTADAWRF